MNSAECQKAVRARSSVLIRTALFVGALLILTAGLMSWAGYLVARNIIRDQIHKRLLVAATDRHDMALAFANQQLERAGLVASRTKLRNLIAQFERGEISVEAMREGTRPILEDAKKSTDGFRSIWIADPEGRVLTSTDESRLDQSVTDEPAFQAGLTRRHLGEPVLMDDVYVTSVAAPALTNDGDLLGVVLVDVDVSRLDEILGDTNGLGNTGEVLVGTRKGDSVEYLFPPRYGEKQSTRLDDIPPMAAAIGGAADSQVTEYNGVEVLVYYRPIEYQPLDYRPWGLIAKIDVEEAYEPLAEFQRVRLVVQAGLLIVGLAGSVWLSRRLTRPIRDLTETATAVAQGDLSAQVAVSSDDEVGVLARTFNTMTRQLQSSYATLEDRVRQRTAELSSEITRREEIEQALKENAERIQRIIDTANDAFISMDSKGRVVEWNPQAQAMFGWSRDEVLTRSLAETIIPEQFRKLHTEGLSRFLETREAHVLNRRLELQAVRRDGSEFPVELTITPQRLDDDFVFNAFLHDITQRKNDERELREARESAESANRSKSEFLANMSHEIRTPMNGIIGMAELLSGTRLEADQRDYLKMVRQSADSLLRLLNDILDFSKIEAGKLELESIPFSLRDCIGSTGHTLSARASSKGLELACRIAPNLPDILIGDPGRLRQVIVNLAGNAIKFTENGEVVIDVAPVSTVSAEDDSKDAVDAASGTIVLRVSVRDTGIGIPPEKQKVIFEAFGQADASTTRQYGGTGLGLAISTQLVEMMNGEIGVESEVGKGTTFSFTMEFGIARQQKLRRPGDLAALQGMPVLVVDDNETNRRILYEMLESWNLKPISVTGGEEALSVVQKRRADGETIPLVLLDYMMPEMDGFEFARRLRETVSDEECTVIMVSSAIQVGDSERCRELKIARCMPKPVMHSELLNTILTEFQTEPATGSESSDPLFQVDEVVPRRILLAEDGVVNQKVAVGFLEKRGHQVEVVVDGQQAVDVVGRERFDLLLMDVQMPVMDGFAATAMIRRLEEGTKRHLPIIAMTANAMKGDRERCIDAGMDNYVAKPVNPDELFKAVEAVPAGVLADSSDSGTVEDNGHGDLVDHDPESGLDDSQGVDDDSNADVSENADYAHQSHSGSGRMIHWETAMARMPGGDAVAKDLAELLVKEGVKYVAQMRESLQSQDAETLRRAAHTLKGSANIFEAVELSELSERMEAHAKAGEFESGEVLLVSVEEAVARLNEELTDFIQST